ncbi:MAG: rhodanese-like domain-containing protein [Myxococcota bacterium]
MRPFTRLAALTSLLALVPLPASAITVEELEALLARGESVRIVDVRNRDQYARGHILGAINVPAKIIAHKRMPRLGFIVAYGDGLNVAATRAAVASLNEKPGIRAEILEGGYPAWNGRGLPRSGEAGLETTGLQLTYAQLLETLEVERDLVLVDLRAPSDEGLEDLELVFPGARVIGPRGSSRSRLTEGRMRPLGVLGRHDYSPDTLYVLIDSGDGRLAETAARRLAGRGIKRVAILVGGGTAVRLRGQSETHTITTPGRTDE